MKKHRMLKNTEHGTLFMWTPLLAARPNMVEVNMVDEEIKSYLDSQTAIEGESSVVSQDDGTSNVDEELTDLLGKGTSQNTKPTKAKAATTLKAAKE